MRPVSKIKEGDGRHSLRLEWLKTLMKSSSEKYPEGISARDVQREGLGVWYVSYHWASTALARMAKERDLIRVGVGKYAIRDKINH